MKWDFFTFMRGFSEFSATAIFMLVCCMGEAVNAQNSPSSFIPSLNYGLAVIVVMHIYGFISGAHVNPSVSITCCFCGYISSATMVLYVFCQFFGAAIGYYALLNWLPQTVIDDCKTGVCITEPMSRLSNLQILSIECFLTCVLLLGWCALWDVRNGRFFDSVSLRLGLLSSACCFAGGKLTGASMNPAKTLIPVLFKGTPQQVVLQVAGQLLASVLVSLLWRFAYTPKYRAVPYMNFKSSQMSF